MSVVTEFQPNLTVDYQSLAREIVQHIRGSLSQRELSDKLNYTFNQVGKWESGATQIKWDDFIQICQVQKVPLEQAFRECFWSCSPEFNTAMTLRALSDTFSAAHPLEASFHTALKKWDSRKSDPDLAEILRLIGTAPAVLLGWLSLFIDCEKIEVLAAPYRKLSCVLNTLSDHPSAAFAHAALRLNAYQSLSFHDETLLAEHSACTRSQLRSTLEHMLSAGMIRFDGQKFYPVSNGPDLSWLNHPKFKTVTHRATLHAAQRFVANPNTRPPNLANNVSYASERTACLSNAAAIEISRRILRFHNEVEEIIHSDVLPKNNVQVILAHTYLPVAYPCQESGERAPTPPELKGTKTATKLPSLNAVHSEPESKIDYACAARQILQVMRGTLSQRQLSYKLGYSFNQVGKWESGATQLKWDDFFHICNVLGVSIEHAFWQEFLTPESELTPLTALKVLNHHFTAGTNLDKQIRRSMEKWLSGKSVPDFAEVLKFMSGRIALMLTWLSEIVNCSKIPSLSEANAFYFARSQTVFKASDTMLIYSALCLDAYQQLENHNEELLTRLTSCSVTQIREVLQALNSNGFVHFDGHKYHPLPYSEAHSRNWEAVCRSTQRAALRYSSEPLSLPGSAELPFDFSVARSRVVALSAKGSRLLCDLIWKYQSEIGEVIKRDKSPKHHIVTVILHSYRSNTNAPNDPDSEAN